MQADWNLAGEEHFEFVVVEEAEGQNVLDELESQFIAAYREKGLCYNVLNGGLTGRLGIPLTAEAKRKIGAKNRENMTGRTASAETRAKMSASQKRRVWTAEAKQRHAEHSRAANLGRKQSAETKERLRRINQQNPPSAKLTPDDVRNIRRRFAAGEKQVDLAKEYSTAPSYISNVIHGRRWGHIT